MSDLFAFLFRMKFIRRWGLMHSTYPENVQEHSQRVALIAHALALIRNRLFGGDVDADRVAALALYHDASEALTGDLPAPVKYRNPEIRRAYHGIEATAEQRLLDLVPDSLREVYEPLLTGQRRWEDDAAGGDAGDSRVGSDQASGAEEAPGAEETPGADPGDADGPAGDEVARELIKAADRLCAYIKCLEELRAGNSEFNQARETLRQQVEAIDLPEVHYFLDTFVPSFELTLDELG